MLQDPPTAILRAFLIGSPLNCRHGTALTKSPFSVLLPRYVVITRNPVEGAVSFMPFMAGHSDEAFKLWGAEDQQKLMTSHPTLNQLPQTTAKERDWGRKKNCVIKSLCFL